MKFLRIINHFSPIVNAQYGTWYPMGFKPVLEQPPHPLGENISEDVLVAISVGDDHFYSAACWRVKDGVPKIDFAQAENPAYSPEELEAHAVAWMLFPPMPSAPITKPAYAPCA